ncbi:MAG: biotin--[acetyl-CoA-carboxylase] ligase [Desulfatitalea sp.]|nr:biotin--[acetyl-CoA-carboxylase] ligase [Desulfatitalea sp.]
MKAEIIAQLTQSPTPVSGQHLSRSLGVSRVAIWKHIRALQVLGYDIEATSKGYRLHNAPDTPFPWRFGARADRLHYYPELDSTMDKAMELARQGCPPFTVVVAGRQTKGRGRLQRTWHSQTGGLYFTMVLRPLIPPAQSPLINLAAAVDLADTLDDLYGIDVRLKWPNDLLVNDLKLSGILSQIAADPDRIEFVNLGIGLNVRNSTRDIGQAAVALADLASAKVSRTDILAAFWDRLEQRLTGAHLADAIVQWRRRAITLGRRVKIQTLTDLYEGRAVDIDATGGLILQSDNGSRQTVVYGDCFHVGPNVA